MNTLKRFGLILLFLSLFIMFVACSSTTNETESTSNQSEQEQNEKNVATGDEKSPGGILNIAIDAQPPTLDQPASTAVAARDASRLIFESLVTTDAEFNPVPMLAESIDTDNNETYTFHLRKGVKFHNGKEMIAEDVVASMERWLEKSTITGNIFVGATWSEIDDYTVGLQLTQPSSLTLDTLATSKQAPGIMPKEIVESAPSEGVEQYIGTGPFEFVEWRQDQYIHYKKFADYVPVTEPADGLAGKKEALIDEVYIHMVPDPSTRLTGLQTGEYDFIFGVPYDNYDQLLEDANLDVILSPSTNQLLGLNNVEGPAADMTMRQIVNTALDVDEIMMAAYPNKDFYWLDSGYMDVNIKNWASTAGSEYYNQNDPEKAKEMLAEIGYENEEFRIMTTRDYDQLYNVGVVVHDQLKNIGLNATLEVYDWPTMLELRDTDLSAWDAFISSSTTVSTPPQLIALSPTWAGGVNDDYVGELMEKIEFAPTIEEAQDTWDELQLYAWEELLPIVQLGGASTIYGHHKNVEGIVDSSGPIFWNVTISTE